MQEIHTHLETTYLKNYLPSAFSIQKVDLHFDIVDDYTIVKSILNITKNTETNDLVLMGENLILESVLLNGKLLSKGEYKKTEKELIIFNAPDNQFLLETRVKIFPKKNTQLMGLYQSRTNMCTQCESEGFRRITYYLDRPDVMAYFTVSISADKTKFPILLSNGNLIEKKILDQNRHWVKWEDPSKKPCYLFALVAGDFDVIEEKFITMKKRTVKLFVYVEKGFVDQAQFAMQALIHAMKWDEDTFGREYDLDQYMIVAVSDFNMGAMENKGLNIFNTKYILAKPETATDQDYMHIESVIGHEYFHNWSGNRITCRDWFQLTLKEGLTVFREQLFTEDMTSCGVARIDTVNTIRNQQFPEDAGPMAHPIRPDSYMKIDNFYTSTVYYKGSEVIRMIRTLITPEIFRKGMDIYFSDNDGMAVTTEDFVHAMEKASGKDLSQFKLWYDQAGTPVLHIKTNYDANKKTYEIAVKQTCAPTPNQLHKKPFEMPLAVGLINSSGVAILKTTILDINKSEEKFILNNITEKPIPSLLRHFSAPVTLKYDYTDAELALLFQYDTDAFCRFEAGQRLAVNTIGAIAILLAEGQKPNLPTLLINSFEKLLLDPSTDLYFLSRLLVLPSLSYLLTHINQVDLEFVFEAKNFVERSLASALEKLWLAAVEKNKLVGPYVFDMTSTGHRRLKNQSLYYLLKTEKERYFDLAFRQVADANNMTDKLGGLVALNDHPVGLRNSALDYFYESFQNEPLVINKWLTLQASSTILTTLDDVKNLLNHPAFDIKNPNNVYALLVTFGDNTVRFNDASGMSYVFLREQVEKLDQQNPQVAARVIQPLTRWRQMDSARGTLMKKQLKILSDIKTLSSNLVEIVTKSLV